MVNVSNFKEFVEKINRDINEKYDNFSFKFADIRETLRRQRVNKKECLFSIKEDKKDLKDLSKKRMYYINGGSQNEIQYHIQKRDCIYYGIGFSLKNSNTNFNTLTYMKPFIDVLFNADFKKIIDEYSKKGYRSFVDDENSCIECNINDFREYKIGKYYLFGKSIRINNNEISDEDYENMLNNFTNDLFNLYKKIFTMRNEFMDNKKMPIDNNNDLLHKCQELLESNYNLILTGAPGTGKTYLAKQIAAKMIFGEDISLDEIEKDENKKNKFELQYKFVQFHPSYDYTDFVEGIRPVTKENNNYVFGRKDGIFKEFCKRAVKNILDSKKPVNIISKEKIILQCLDEFSNEIMEKINEQGMYELTETSKIYNYEPDDESINFNIINNTNRVKIYNNEIFQMYEFYSNTLENNQNYKIKDFLNYSNRKCRHQTYYHNFISVFYSKYSKKINSEYINDVDANIVKKENFVFVIDEINRGDINKILGELFYAIDLGYRGEKGKVDTQYQNLIEGSDVFSKGFYIPENVYIIGTMNDIDRSVESMDFAIRRRFAWYEINPNDTAKEILKNLEIDNYVSESHKKSDEILKKLNECISGKDENGKVIDKDALGEMYQIGASYFLNLDKYINNDEENQDDSIKNAYQKLWDNHLKGLIYEYVRGKKSGNDIFNKIQNKYFELTGIKEIKDIENNEDSAE